MNIVEPSLPNWSIFHSKKEYHIYFKKREIPYIHFSPGETEIDMIFQQEEIFGIISL